MSEIISFCFTVSRPSLVVQLDEYREPFTPYSRSIVRVHISSATLPWISYSGGLSDQQSLGTYESDNYLC